MDDKPKAIAVKIAWNDKNWEEYDAKSIDKINYRYVKSNGIAHEWWSFNKDIDEKYYYSTVPGKMPKNDFKGTIFFISRSVHDHKMYLIGVYGEGIITKSLGITINLDGYLGEMKKKHPEHYEKNRREGGFKWKPKIRGEKSKSFALKNRVEITTTDLDIKRFGSANFFYLKNIDTCHLLGNMEKVCENKRNLEIIKWLKEKHGCDGMQNAVGDYKNKIYEALETKKQLILYGPPGTGKTFKARNFAESEGATRENERLEIVTFHPSFSYEDFVEGIRPQVNKNKDGNSALVFRVEDGIFKKMTIKAIWSAISTKLADFDGAWSHFKVLHPVGSVLKTSKENKEFKIEEYTNDGLKITPLESKSQKLIFIEKYKLKELWVHDNIKDTQNVRAIIGETFRHSYYLAIYFELKRYANAELGYNEIKNIVMKYLESKKLIDFSNAPKYYLIIDEINRGDISKIFGELITLLEKDKRLFGNNEITVTLPYSKTTFGVPPNLYIIGTMNTADRSIALIDVALRRRFAFIEMMPSYSVLLKKLLKEEKSEKDAIDEITGWAMSQIGNDPIKLAIKALYELNKRIRAKYDRDHQIGHSYYLQLERSSGDDLNDKLRYIWLYEILPLIQEYFYGNDTAVKNVLFECGKNTEDIFECYREMIVSDIAGFLQSVITQKLSGSESK